MNRLRVMNFTLKVSFRNETEKRIYGALMEIIPTHVPRPIAIEHPTAFRECSRGLIETVITICMRMCRRYAIFHGHHVDQYVEVYRERIEEIQHIHRPPLVWLPNKRSANGRHRVIKVDANAGGLVELSDGGVCFEIRFETEAFPGNIPSLCMTDPSYWMFCERKDTIAPRRRTALAIFCCCIPSTAFSSSIETST